MKTNFLAISLVCSLTVLLISCDSEKQKAEDNDQRDQSKGDWYANGANAVMDRATRPLNRSVAKNIIIFIGDGMSISTQTAARIYEGQLRGEMGEENFLSFEQFPNVALVKTYNVNAQVPDSAGTASAMMTGVKTKAGVVGVTENQVHRQCEGIKENTITNLAELAEDRGMATGVVTTARITHATPASFYAHSPYRYWENDSQLPADAAQYGCSDIAAQLIAFDHGDGLDVMLGGGRASFYPKGQGLGLRNDGRDLTKEWQANNPKGRYVINREEFLAVEPTTTSKLLGLFTPNHMTFDLDRGGQEPSLSEMTLKAVTLLSQNKKGYLLMVEAGKIDLAHHKGNAARALHDTVALSKAIADILPLIDLNETLVLVTADHGHSLTIVGDWGPERGNNILGLVQNNQRGIRLADDDKPFTTLQYANGPGAGKRATEILTEELTTDPDYLQQATVPLRSEIHSGEDVALFAIGPRSYVVGGTIEQNEIYHIIAYALGWQEP